MSAPGIIPKQTFLFLLFNRFSRRISELKLALLEDFDGDNIRNDEVDDYGDG